MFVVPASVDQPGEDVGERIHQGRDFCSGKGLASQAQANLSLADQATCG
ncbi:hypothetical protein ACQPWW_13515 [Micromonospora sp. CA-240977]